MKSSLNIARCGVAIVTLFFFTACSSNKNDIAAAGKKVPPVRKWKPSPPAIQVNEQGTLTFPDYELTLYGAFAFQPENNGSSLVGTEKGKQYIVLDLGVQNTSEYESVDMGSILLSAKVTDEKGNVYPANPLAVAAYQMAYPDQNQKTEYKAMKGKIKPGRYYRATAFGFEAPVSIKSFVITLNHNGDFRDEGYAQRAKFSVD
ncbi:hypothetical protein [Flavisolibacter nicotianae]|uniref:hypothetical protein n=1 Tax=Flavisolibacter nicotianae TaxID=2364882 RepID=UPI000EAC6AF0|nr:hypothetical protein [Flavisolibacter nicotianae]